jgi:hypothetical protein
MGLFYPVEQDIRRTSLWRYCNVDFTSTRYILLSRTRCWRLSHGSRTITSVVEKYNYSITEGSTMVISRSEVEEIAALVKFW